MTGDDIGERVKKHFAAFDRAKFAEWLKEGLRNSYSPFPDKPHPFDPVYPELVFQDMRTYWDQTDFLEIVYADFFSDSGKKMFRGAISDVLYSQTTQPELGTEARKDLIYLIPRVEAIESLESLVSFVDKAKLEKDSEELYSAIAVLKSFSSLPRKVCEAVERLTDSPNFDDGYLFEIISLLVENQPSNARNILEKFEPRIKKLWDSLPDDAKERRAFLDVKEDCLRRVSRVADVAQYKGTLLQP